MKAISISHGRFTLFVASLIIFQSCTVYQGKSVSLQEASQTRTKTKLRMRDGSIQRFQYIQPENQFFYGIKRVGYEDVKFRVDADDIKSIRLVNKPASFTLSVLGIAIPLAVLVNYIFFF